MVRLLFNQPTNRFGTSGLHNGVIHVNGRTHVWDGLISVNETNTESERGYIYIDGVRVNVAPRNIEQTYSIDAFSYPRVVEECFGSTITTGGAILSGNLPKMCNIAWMTDIYDAAGNKFPQYHLLFNALLSVPSLAHSTTSGSNTIETFKFDVQSLPVIVTGYTPQSKVTIDGRYASDSVLEIVDSWLFGSKTANAIWPTLKDILRVTTENTAFDIGTETRTPGVYTLVDGSMIRGSTANGVFKILDTSKLVETSTPGVYEMR